MPVLSSQHRNEIGKYQNTFHEKILRNRFKSDRNILTHQYENREKQNMPRFNFSLMLAKNTTDELRGLPHRLKARNCKKNNFINALFLFSMMPADSRMSRVSGITNDDTDTDYSGAQKEPVDNLGISLYESSGDHFYRYHKSYPENNISQNIYKKERQKRSKDNVHADIKNEWFFSLPGVDAGMVSPVKETSQASERNYHLITSEKEIDEFINSLQKEMIDSGRFRKDDGENFKYYMREKAAGYPVIYSPLEENNSWSGKEGFRHCNFIEEVVNSRGEKLGCTLNFQARNGDTLLNKSLNLASLFRENPIRSDGKTTAQMVTLGMDVSFAKLIIEAKRNAYKKNFDDQLCSKELKRFPIAGLAEATDVDIYTLEYKAPLKKPDDLKKALPAHSFAAFFLRNPQSGIRTEVILEIARDKGVLADAGRKYLMPTNTKNEYVVWQPDAVGFNKVQEKVIFDTKHSKWYFKDDKAKSEINVKIREGMKQVNLYGDYFNIYEDGAANKLIGYINDIGIKEYLPIYQEPLSKRWHVDKLNGYAAFTHEEEKIIKSLQVKLDRSSTYRVYSNNNPILYGEANLYEQINPLSLRRNVIEIKGSILPVRNVKHAGQGVLYEIYNEKKPDLKGYQIEWSGTRWIFAGKTSAHIFPSLKKKIKPDMLFINQRQFMSVSDITKKKSNIIKRDSPQKAGTECPSWEKIYEELEYIAQKDQVISVRHRGDLDDNIAENSLSAFRQSYKKCRVAIETDVLTTKDGEMVIFHDTRIGKMMEPSYNPDRNTGPNDFLKDKTLAELKGKKLLNPQREPTEDTIITVQELIEDYISQRGQSQIYLEVKDSSAILRVARVLYDKSSDCPDLLNRVIIKFNMAEFPTPKLWYEGLNKVGVKSIIMANPVISPFAAKRINSLPYELPNPPDKTLYDNASKAVYAWSNTPGTSVPNVEVVIKSSENGFISTKNEVSVQGKYKKPVSLDMSNTVPGSPAYWVSIVKNYNKALGTYVPISDRIMWNKGIVAGITVPNVNYPDKPVDITTAYYNNDSRCCYTLEDKLAEEETEDVRGNLAWNRGIGANIITSDDTDSIDTYYDKMGQLDKKAMPNPRYPLKEMYSTLSWDLDYYKKPIFSSVNIKGWGGAFAKYWGGTVCLWDNPYKYYPWVYNCEVRQLYDYNKELQTRVVKTEHFGDAIQIYDHAKKTCLSAKGDHSTYYSWTTSCHLNNAETHFRFTPYGNLRALYYGKDTTYTEFDHAGYYYNIPYGVLKATNTPGSWADWSIEPSRE